MPRHSKWYAVARRNFEAGTWSVAMLSNVHDKRRITDSEYQSLLDDALAAGRISQEDHDGALAGPEEP